LLSFVDLKMKNSSHQSLSLDSRSVASVLCSITALLTLIHIVILCIYYWIDDEEQFDFVRLIDMDYEGNIPTLFSSVLFFISALLFWMLGKWEGKQKQITSSQPSNGRAWFGLAAVFVFLGVDEGTKIHEYVGDFMERFVEAEGFLYFPWIVPYVAVFIVLVILYLPFFLRLSAETKKGLVISAILFLTGAVVFDSVGGWEADRNSTSTILYSVLYTIEEVLEMLGLIMLIKTLMETLTQRNFVLRNAVPEKI